MPEAVQFGAGNIGRGFLGQLYFDAGWNTTFVDVNEKLLDALNARRGYEIRIVGPGARKIAVENVRAIDARDTDAVAEALSRADLAATAVGVNALKAVAPTIAVGLDRRARARPDSTLNIIVCENMIGAPEHLRSLLLETATPLAKDYIENRLGLVAAVVARMIPPPRPELAEEDPGAIEVEAYSELPVDATGFKGKAPDMPGIVPAQNFRSYEERKLFSHNCGHAIAAYLGFLRGCEYIWQVVEDEELAAKVKRGMAETGEALVRRHKFAPERHQACVDDLLLRFSNRALGDTVKRVGRDPARKLRREDRLVGAALMCLEEGVEPVTVAEAIAAAARFHFDDDPSSSRVQQVLSRGGIEAVLAEICSLEPGKLWRMVLDADASKT